MNKIESSNRKAKTSLLALDEPVGQPSSLEQGLVDIKALAYFTSMSERLIFNLRKDEAFWLKIGRRLLFEKKAVVDYLVRKYGNWSSSV